MESEAEELLDSLSNSMPKGNPLVAGDPIENWDEVEPVQSAFTPVIPRVPETTGIPIDPSILSSSLVSTGDSPLVQLKKAMAKSNILPINKMAKAKTKTTRKAATHAVTPKSTRAKQAILRKKKATMKKKVALTREIKEERKYRGPLKNTDKVCMTIGELLRKLSKYKLG